jgi:hypothetical protein
MDDEQRGDSLFECIALVCVAKDALHKLKNDLPPEKAFIVDLILNDLNKSYKNLNSFYEHMNNITNSGEGWSWLRLHTKNTSLQ